MPFADGSFELVYCKQVLEHVRHPERLLAEVYRVLVPGGWFAGSTSQLELYHSLSLWNYTPVGFVELIEAVGLRAGRAATGDRRPDHHGLALGWRAPFFHRWWERESPLNRALNASARVVRADVPTLNATKLLFCGQFAFLARREESTT